MDAAADPIAIMASMPRALNLLIAEDQEMNRLVLEALLQPAPVTLTFVENGKEALEAMSTGTFDAGLIDIRMPVMSGLDFIRTLRANERESDMPHVPMIACSANVMREQVQSYIAAGFDGHLSKPIALDELAACMVRLAGMRVAESA